MKELEKCLKALANKRRLAILKILMNKKEATVGELAGAINLSFKSTSKHLAVLKSADIVEHEQRGISYFYKLNPSFPPGVKAIVSLL